MSKPKTSRYQVGDNVTKIDGDSRVWHIYEIYTDVNDKGTPFNVYLMHTRSNTMNEFGGFGTEYGQARGSELRKVKESKKVEAYK